MRIATGNIGHESSTFTPIETPYEAFQEASRGFHRGPEVIEAMSDTNTGCGGFIDSAATHGYELVPILWTFAEPSGPVHAEAWARLKSEFLERLEAAMPVDGALLDLHGAMVIQGIDDGEGDLLRGVRSILGPDRPVVVTLDLHANISDTMAELSDVIIPCDTYPHVDFRERGREAADLIVRTLRGEIRPTMAVELLPLLWAGGNVTGFEPFDGIVARAHQLEAQPGILTASVNPGVRLGPTFPKPAPPSSWSPTAIRPGPGARPRPTPTGSSGNASSSWSTWSPSTTRWPRPAQPDPAQS